MSRRGMPSRRNTAVAATASVEDTTAPRMKADDQEMPGQGEVRHPGDSDRW